MVYSVHMATALDIWLYVNPAYCDCVFYPQTTVLFTSFKQAGVKVVVGADDFAKVVPSPGDKLITYGNFDVVAPIVEQYFAPDNRWIYVVDEQGGGDPAPYSRCLSYMEKRGTKNILLTYQNAQHLASLTAKGVKFVVMPHCVLNVRPRTQKPGDILISGQQVGSYYPNRVRVANVLRQAVHRPGTKFSVTTLPYPGFDVSTATHDIIGEKYLDYLDQFKMGAACRGDWHDRFVGKYVEMGACHVLPVGDCPTYMPLDMQRAMVDVAPMTDAQLVAEIERLLATPDELTARQDAFTAVVEKTYTALPNAQRVVKEILAG